ncbi:ClpP/crotonase [Aspergillus sclerotiicarbonarius CBS 121057]|uniref:ClpP/crotonase n=1 Tax=Aspergillus sclerotiicarbonarius (strain CBS 121057 / IBT 28362) TaxID=1448318 RepID=A0A319DUV5_ASPSB|nr:ClpP/crotonase [Aspergillus sclerotiicarbonarius CBS 121057]
MWLELSAIFTQLSSDPSVRSIVLTGAGDRAFTAGLDVKAASEGLLSDSPEQPGLDAARRAAHHRRHIASFQDCISSIEKCEKPVIVALHGIALGLAIDISVAADVRVCSSDVRFAVKEADIGLAADIGTLSRLPKVVGNFGWVKEVALTAREFGADEALRVGFVNRVFGTKEDAIRGALELAALIATKSPVAVQGTKELLNYSRDHTVQEGLRYTTVWNSAMLQTKDVSAALLSGIQKRKPTFEKL